VNHKRVQRLWREEGLRQSVRTRKRRRRDSGNAELLRAERSNQVWALDFQFNETTDPRQLKSLPVVDEHTREALAMRVGRACTSDEVVAVLGDPVAARGAPEHLPMDNGPEMIAWALRDYCRLAGLAPCSSSPASHGRTRSWSPSTAAPATKCSTRRSSPPCSRPRSSSKPGGPSTTPTDRTPSSTT